MTISNRGGRPSKRAYILNNALELARQQGPQGFTLDALCEFANISKGGILYHFSCVYTLVSEMLTLHLKQVLQHQMPQYASWDSLPVNSMIELLQTLPTEPNLEMLFMKTYAEAPLNQQKRQSLQGIIGDMNDSQRIALFAAFGERMSRIYGAPPAANQTQKRSEQPAISVMPQPAAVF